MDQILKIKLGREVKDYLSITFGLICYALGWAAFLLPYQITTGGVTGISAIIYYVTGIEIQVSYFIINAVFLGFALKILGPKFSLKTIYAIFMLTFLLWLFQALLKNPDGTLPIPNPSKPAPTTQAMNSCPGPNNCGSVPSGFFNNA